MYSGGRGWEGLAKTKGIPMDMGPLVLRGKPWRYMYKLQIDMGIGPAKMVIPIVAFGKEGLAAGYQR